MPGEYAHRSVLVTGGCGFIGSHLVEALLAAGAHVRVLGRYSSSGTWGHLQHLRHNGALDVRLGSITDHRFVDDCVRGVDGVFHLAALIGIPYSYVAPVHNIETNVIGTLNVLEAVRRHSPGRLVHTSTSECFGSAQYVPMDEKHPIVAQSPYAASKAAADQLVGSYVRSFGIPAVVVRPFNTFGPRQSLRAVIPTIISQALVGDEVRLGSLEPIRDLNPVANTVSGMMRAGAVDGVDGELFVIGSGVGRTVGEVVESVGAILGRELVTVVEESRVRPAASEIDRLVCDNSLAEGRLGYRPAMTFDAGLRATIDWMRQFGSRSAEFAI